MNTRTVNFIFVMVVTGAIALTLGSSALLRLSVCMLFMLILALFTALFALLTARVRVVVGSARVERGSRLAYQVQLTHKCLLPVGAFRVALDGAENEAEEMELGGMPFRVLSHEGNRAFVHRGVYTVGSGSVTVTDVFDLFSFSKRFVSPGGIVTVVPRARELAPMNFQMGDVGPEVTRRNPDDASSPSGVREWRDGDLLKRIHWKLTMKMYDPTLTNIKPMVRTYDEAARPDTIVLPDMTRVDAVAERAKSIEDAISEACLSIIKAQLEDLSPVRMLVGGSVPMEIEGRNGADVAPFADAFAKAQFDSDEPYEQALSETTRRLDRTGAIILVTSRLTLRVADCAIRLRQMSNTSVAVIWITDSGRADAEKLVSRLEMADVIARRDNPFQTEEQ